MPTGYSTKANAGRVRAGFGIVCDIERHLALDSDAEGRQDKVPYATEAQAQSRLDLIERMGLCLGEHRIVAVWATTPGRYPKVQ
jgi:hypothetical protein